MAAKHYTLARNDSDALFAILAAAAGPEAAERAREKGKGPLTGTRLVKRRADSTMGGTDSFIKLGQLLQPAGSKMVATGPPDPYADYEDKTIKEFKALHRGRLPPGWQELELYPGDTILIPAGWWHAVDTARNSLAVAFDLQRTGR